MIKRWLPFLFLISVIIISISYLFFSTEESVYRPDTDDPAVIYREACQHCHGKQGQGTGLLYPAFDENLTVKKIESSIVTGDLLMPAFIYIKGDTLNNLVEYIYTRSYKK